MKSNKKNVIIFNHMFTGNYLANNIGHEVINLFAADDDKKYIYLCKDGTYNRCEKPKYIIQVRRPHHSVHTLEIISIARGIADYKDNPDNPVTYGGKNINNIFKQNTHQQEQCITFQVENIIKPNQPIYIIYQEDVKETELNCIFLQEKKKNNKDEEKYAFNVSQTLREYFLEGSEDYTTLEKFCDNAFASKEGWSQLEQIDIANKTLSDYPTTPADIYGIGTWELAYSNALKYFLDNNKEFLVHFCRKCYEKFNHKHSPNNGLPALEEPKTFKIFREWNHIDLLIEYECEDKKFVFVIENKIFSDLNGKDGDQLERYKNKIEESENGKKPTYQDWTKIYILLTPDHNKIKEEDVWCRVLYSDVYDICEKTNDETNDFVLFKKMIEMHKETDFHYAIMKHRFEKALLQHPKE